MKSAPRCKYCRAPFQPMKYWQIYCSPVCRLAYHEAQRRKGLALLAQQKRRS